MATSEQIRVGCGWVLSQRSAATCQDQSFAAVVVRVVGVGHLGG